MIKFLLKTLIVAKIFQAVLESIDQPKHQPRLAYAAAPKRKVARRNKAVSKKH